MKQKQILRFVLLVSVLLLLSACTGGDKDKDKTKDSDSETTSTAITDKDSTTSESAIGTDNVDAVFSRIGLSATQIETSFGAITVKVPEGEVRPAFTSENPSILLGFTSLNYEFYETPFTSDYKIGDSETCTGLNISCADLFSLKKEITVDDFISALNITEFRNTVDEMGNKNLYFVMKDRMIVLEVPNDSISPESIAYVTNAEAYNW